MTRDEFMDIMGKVDEKLVDGALDIPRMEVIELKYERPPVLRYIMGFAACIAILVTVIAVRYMSGVPVQPNDTSESADSSYSVPEFTRGWDPEELSYGDLPELGGNVRVSVAELDGITAELILHNIKKEAGTYLFNELTNYEYTDYVGAEDIVLYVHDNKGRRFIEGSVTPHSFNGMELISAQCLFEDCTRLYKVNDEYVLMQYADYNCPDYNSDKKALIARFYTVGLNRHARRDENGIYDGGFTSVKIEGGARIGGWGYGYQASKEFEYAGDAKFSDPIYRYEMLWSESGKVVYPGGMPLSDDMGYITEVGWNPDKLPLILPNEALPGENVMVASDNFGDVTAALILHNIIKRPGERHYIYPQDEYLDMWAADGMYLYITDAEGHRVLSRVPAITDGLADFLPDVCVNGNTLRLFQLNDGRYVIMLNIIEENGKPKAIFVEGDPEQYADSPKDENGIFICDEPRVIDENEVSYDYIIPFYDEEGDEVFSFTFDE